MQGVWHPKVLLYAWGLAAAVVITPSEVVLGTGAIVYALLLFKGQRGKVIRDQNHDLTDRNTFLEAECVRIKAEAAEQAAALNAQMVAEASEQRQLRHELKNRLAIVEGQLRLEEAKHDLTTMAANVESALSILTGREEMFKEMAEGIGVLARFAKEDHEQGGT